MRYVAEIIRNKADQTVFRVTRSDSVLDAIKAMASNHIGALLVMDGERIEGIVTERDYARKIVLAGRSSSTTPVSEIMTSPVMYVRPDHTSSQCMALMTDNRLRHLPVLDGDRLVGLVSIGDLVKDIISEQQFVIEQLELYIRGDRG